MKFQKLLMRCYFLGLIIVFELKNDNIRWIWWCRGCLMACNKSSSLTKNSLLFSENFFSFSKNHRLLRLLISKNRKKFGNIWSAKINLRKWYFPRNLCEPQTLILVKIYPLKIFFFLKRKMILDLWCIADMMPLWNLRTSDEKWRRFHLWKSCIFLMKNVWVCIGLETFCSHFILEHILWKTFFIYRDNVKYNRYSASHALAYRKELRQYCDNYIQERPITRVNSNGF